MTHPATDIIVPVHNALSYLRHCIDTVCTHTSNYRIVFVDDCSDQDTKNYLQSAINDHSDWLVVHTDKRKWFTRAANMGLRLVKTEKALLLNSDTEVNAGWLQEMYDVWDDVKRVNSIVNIGLVGSISCITDPATPRWIYTNVNNGGYVSGHCWL